MFRGSDPSTVDDKGRCKLPSSFKDQLGAEKDNPFFITSVDGKFAEVWPLTEWQKNETKLAKVSSLDQAVTDYMNLVNFYGHQVTLDAQGRLLLPKMLRGLAKLDGEILVVGRGKFLAVYNRDVFMQEILPKQGLTPERLDRVNAVLNAPDGV